MEEGGRGEGVASEARTLLGRLLREYREEILPRIAGIRDETRRFLLLLAWLNTRLEEAGLGRIILTGGFAVEVYTGRVYRTMDVDVIVEGVEAARLLEAFLREVGERIGRGYLPRDALLEAKSIDIVATVYTRPAPPVLLKVGEYRVYIEPPEELILRYLAGWIHWGSTEDRDKALWLYIVWHDRLDMAYLERRAREERVYDALRELERLAEYAARVRRRAGQERGEGRDARVVETS